MFLNDFAINVPPLGYTAVSGFQRLQDADARRLHRHFEPIAIGPRAQF